MSPLGYRANDLARDRRGGHAEVGNERGETGSRRSSIARGAHLRDELASPPITCPHQGRVGHEPHFQLDPALSAGSPSWRRPARDAVEG